MKKLNTLEQPDMFSPSLLDVIDASATTNEQTTPSEKPDNVPANHNYLIPGIGWGDRDAYNAIMLGGNSSPFIHN